MATSSSQLQSQVSKGKAGLSLPLCQAAHCDLVLGSCSSSQGGIRTEAQQQDAQRTARGSQSPQPHSTILTLRSALTWWKSPAKTPQQWGRELMAGIRLGFVIPAAPLPTAGSPNPQNKRSQLSISEPSLTAPRGNPARPTHGG